MHFDHTRGLRLYYLLKYVLRYGTKGGCVWPIIKVALKVYVPSRVIFFAFLETVRLMLPFFTRWHRLHSNLLSL